MHYISSSDSELNSTESSFHQHTFPTRHRLIITYTHLVFSSSKTFHAFFKINPQNCCGNMITPAGSIVLFPKINREKNPSSPSIALLISSQPKQNMH